MVDKEAGADRKRMLRTLSTKSAAGAAAAKARFQQGSVDEISFLGERYIMPCPAIMPCP